MKCKNRPGRGVEGRGGHSSHYPTSIQLARTIPGFLQKRLEPHGGKDSQGRNKFGCLSSFLLLLVCFCRRSLRMRVELPTGPPPSARWRAHAPRQPWRRASNPQSANLRISLRRARQTTWRAPLAPAACSLQPFFQIPSPPPGSGEGAHVAPRSGAPPLHPWGFLGRSLHPPSLSSKGIKNPARLRQPGPKLSRGEKVKGEEGSHKQIFFFLLKRTLPL